MAFDGTLQEFTLLMHGPAISNPCVEVQQADTASRTVRFHLKTFAGADYIIPYAATAVVCINKADGTKVYDHCEIEAQSTVLVTFTTQAIACTGKQKAQIYICTDEGDIKSQAFYVNVPRAVYSEDAIKSSDEFGILQDIINDVDEVVTEKVRKAISDEGGGTGVNGESAYEIAVANGFEGTEEEWLESLRGEDGAAGADGASVTVSSVSESTADGGSNVVTFSDGQTLTVKNGSKGEKGDTGAKGDKGDKGDQGIQGDKGDKGEPGDDGASITISSISESTADSGANVVTFSDGKTLTVKNGSKGSQGEKGDAGADGKDGYSPVKGTDYWTDEDKEEMLAELSADSSWLNGYDIPILYLTGDTSAMTKDVEVSLEYMYGDHSGTCTMKWQGSSSLAYDKKNYTIKLDTKIQVVEGWGEQKKYCLKANFIDHSHARNIGSAKLWGQIVASRTPKNSTLAACPNYGAVDGFPIVIMLNGEFHGLYTWNIPKDKWTFNMGSSTQEAVICANYDTPAVDLRVHAKVDGTDHELEEVTDEDNAAWVAESLNNLIDLCVNSYGADLDSTIAQYMDWESAIDYLILTVLIDGRDMYKKNYIMVTYDGSYWIWSAYDMDSTYGLQWAGKEIYPANDGISFVKFRCNRVMELIYRFKTNALKTRYAELRESVLSEENISVLFENFSCGIPSRLLDEDAKKWTSLPGTSVSNVDQILRWLHRRLAVVDKWIEELPAQETPVAPSTRENNAVLSSINEDGTTYNNIGYKDGYIISISDGVATEVKEDGMTITGYMPITTDDVIQITTDGWNISPTPSRIIFYNSNFEPMAWYTQHGYVGMFNDYTDSTAIKWKEHQSVSYGSDGLVTLNTAYGANCTDLTYCRVMAVGKGANLAVIGPDCGEVVPAEPVNQVPISIDTDGSVYNGVGYKDGYRYGTSAPFTEKEQVGMTLTGYIPVTKENVIRVSSSAWSSSPNYAKILFFNANFEAMAYYTQHGYVATDNGYTTGDESNITSIKGKTNQSVTTGDDGMTTLNIVYGDKCTDLAYIRIDGCGSGADMVVTVE